MTVCESEATNDRDAVHVFPLGRKFEHNRVTGEIVSKKRLGAFVRIFGGDNAEFFLWADLERV